MAIPSLMPPARPVDDAIVDTPWGTWVHDLLAMFPVLQTMRFAIQIAGGVQTRDVMFHEPYPAGWTVIAVGVTNPAITNTSPCTVNVNSVSLDRASCRMATPTNMAYNGGGGTATLTVAGFAPGTLNGPLWRYLAAPVLLEGEARPGPDENAGLRRTMP
jgi:hypothetical protein